MADFAVGQPNPNAAPQQPAAQSAVIIDRINAELARVADQRAAILVNENRTGTVQGSAGGLRKGTVGLTIGERLALVSLDERERSLRASLTAIQTEQQPVTVGNQPQQQNVQMMPMWKADP